MEFRMHNDNGGHPQWGLYACNAKVVVYSGEAFASPYNATRAAEHFKANAPAWNYRVFPDSGGSFRWHAKAGNGEIVATSRESFYDRSNAQRAADNAGTATGP
jgi:uncharacterized protein YegP (UPF0339 family)